MKVVVFDKGNPVATNNKQEATRLKKRLEIIDRVLKEMGYNEGYANYQEIVEKMAREDFDKYLKFLERIDEEVNKKGKVK